MVWMSSIFSWWSHFTVSPPSNKIFLIWRQHWPITNMSESTNIQGFSKSFENSNYSYSSHTTCIAHLSPSSLCYPWSPSYTYIPSIQQYHCLSYNHLTHAVSSYFKPYAARSFFPCVQTITAHFDQLHSQTLFPFQIFSLVHSSVNVD